MKTDSILYKFFEYFPKSLLELISAKEKKSVSYQFKAIDVKETQFHIDGVLIPDSTEAKLYFVEIHFRRKEIYPKLFSEIFIFLKQKKPKNDWEAIVIYPARNMDLGVDKHYKEFADSGRLKRIYLNELNETILNNFPLNLLKIITVNENQIQHIIEEISDRLPKEIRSEKERERIKELTISLVLSKLSKVSIQEVEKMLKPILHDIRKSRAAKQLIREGEIKGKIAGKNERNLEIAKTMLKKGLKVEEISEYTGIKKQELTSLLK